MLKSISVCDMDVLKGTDNCCMSQLASCGSATKYLQVAIAKGASVKPVVMKSFQAAISVLDGDRYMVYSHSH